jgi:hypothetical protein
LFSIKYRHIFIRKSVALPALFPGDLMPMLENRIIKKLRRYKISSKIIIYILNKLMEYKAQAQKGLEQTTQFWVDNLFNFQLALK